MKLQVGIVGLGSAWESRYRPALRALSDRFQVRAVCEHVAHRAEQVAKEFGAAQVDGFRSMVRRPDVDAVLLLDSNWYGMLPVLAACDAGKAVYCAAGWETDFEKAQRLRQRVEESGIAFMAEFPCRHAPATLRLKELIATRLGQPRLLFCHHRGTLQKTAPNRYQRGRPARSMTDTLVELVDWCRYVVGGEPSSVFGVIHHSDEPDCESDYQMMSLDFSGEAPPGTGPVAQISSGRYVRTDWPEAVSFRPPAALQVACERGIAFVDLPFTLIWFDGAGRHMESLENERPMGELLLAQFYRHVTSLVRNTMSVEDAYRALTIVLRARCSHQEGKRVGLP